MPGAFQHALINNMQGCKCLWDEVLQQGLQLGLLAHQLLRDYLTWCMLYATHVDIIGHAG